MRVRISYVEDVGDDFRRAIRRYYGGDGLANRDEIQKWFRLFGQSMNDDLMMAGDDDDDDDEETA